MYYTNIVNVAGIVHNEHLHIIYITHVCVCVLVVCYQTKDQGAIHVIPSNAEKLISISWRQYVFIDSLAFLNASLDKLAQSTPAAAFHHTAEQHPEPIRRDLIRRKGVYPYEYMSSWEKFDDHSLPPREAFYSTLAGAGISEGDYEHAQRVWDVFGCTTMGDYHDLYLQTDVLLLCDIFENFRRTALETYSLDPANYHTLPGFGWDALLKYSDISLDLLSDVDMHQFVEHGMRGGVSMVTRRYAKANNPYIDGFQHEQPTTYLQYLDANNLYGWAMCQYLPTSAFKWETPTDELLEQICAQPDDHSIGYMVECDLLTPESHHDLFSDYPLAPEKLSVKEAMLSPYQQQLAAKLTVSHHGNHVHGVHFILQKFQSIYRAHWNVAIHLFFSSFSVCVFLFVIYFLPASSQRSPVWNAPNSFPTSSQSSVTSYTIAISSCTRG